MRNHWLAISIIIILLLAPVLSLWFSPAFFYCINHDGQYPTTQNDKEGTTSIFISHPSKIRIFITCAGSFANENGSAITALATVLLTIVTGGLVWVGFRQESTIKRQLRAYVFVVEVVIIDIGTTDVKAVIKIRNTGQTPAYKVTISTKARAFNIPGKIEFDPAVIGPHSSRFDFGPDGWGQRSVPLYEIIGPPNAIETLKSGKGVLYVWGEIVYKDTFRDDQHTKFRVMIGGSDPWPSENRMTICPEGNEAT